MIIFKGDDDNRYVQVYDLYEGASPTIYDIIDDTFYVMKSISGFDWRAYHNLSWESMQDALNISIKTGKSSSNETTQTH